MTDIRNVAYDFISRQEWIRRLPLKLVDLFKIADRYGWQILKYSEAENIINEFEKRGISLREYSEGHNGFTLTYDGNIMIFYRGGLSNIDTMFVICHEFGHVILNHVSTDGIIGKSKNEAQTTTLETEADIFASEMLAPLPLLNQFDIKSAADIEQMGLLRGEKAESQLKNLEHLKSRSYFAKSAEEIRLCEHFDEEISLRNRDAKKAKIKNKAFGIGITAIVAVVLVSCCTIFYLYGKNNGNTPPAQEPAPIQQSAEPTAPPTPTQIPTAEPTVIPTATPASDTTQKLVYLTKSGTKYHTVDCPYINQKDTFTMSIEKAKENDYQACKFCRPDEN